MLHIGDRLPPVALTTLDGSVTSLDEQRDGRPTLVLAVRYYGCLPCQHYLVDLDRHTAELEEAGIRVVTVGVAADFQAEHLAQTYDIAMPLLLDADQNLYRALDLPRLRGLAWLRWSTYRNYVPLFWNRYIRRSVDGPTQGRPAGDATQMPGIAILDADGRLAYVHRGQGLGDYPPLAEVLAAARGVVAIA